MSDTPVYTPATGGLKHYVQLDGLRAFAVWGVMIAHWISWDTKKAFLNLTPWNHGVILFFVLSGYLITQILLKQKDKIENGRRSVKTSLKIFFTRRFLRIFPIYYLLIFFLLFINFDHTKEYFPWLVTYTSNFLLAIRGDYIGDFNHLWSLAIEEQFYLFWPLIIFLTPRGRIMKVIVWSAIISFSSRLICAVLYKNGITNWMWGAYFTPNLVLPLALGGALAYIKSEKKYAELYRKLSNVRWLYLSVISYIVLFYLMKVRFDVPYFHELFDEYLFAIACFFLILRAADNRFRFAGKYILEHDVITFTGKISYGLYLYHLFVIGFFWNFISPQFQVHVSDRHAAWIIYFIIAYLIAIPSYYLIETPLNNLKRYFKY